MPEQEVQYLDKQEGLERIRGNQRVYKSVLKSFSQSDLLQQFEAQLVAGDSAEGARTVHAIKGTAGNLSMPALFEVATELEQAMKAGKHTQQDIDEFIQIYRRTLVLVNETLAEMEKGAPA